MTLNFMATTTTSVPVHVEYPKNILSTKCEYYVPYIGTVFSLLSESLLTEPKVTEDPKSLIDRVNYFLTKNEYL